MIKVDRGIMETQLKHYNSYLTKLLFASIGLLIAIFGATIRGHMTHAGIYLCMLCLMNIPVYMISTKKKQLEKELGINEQR